MVVVAAVVTSVHPVCHGFEKPAQFVLPNLRLTLEETVFLNTSAPTLLGSNGFWSSTRNRIFPGKSRKASSPIDSSSFNPLKIIFDVAYGPPENAKDDITSNLSKVPVNSNVI